MIDLAAVRTALAAAAGNAGDLDSLPFIPAALAPPTLAVGRMQLLYDRTFGGQVEAAVTVHAFASLADFQQGQDDLLPLLGPAGVKAAIEADRTLGGTCETLRVESADGPGISDVGGQQYWAASWTVRVWG